MTFEKFEPKKPTRQLARIEAGEVLFMYGKTERAIRSCLLRIIKANPERAYSWDKSNETIVVRRDR